MDTGFAYECLLLKSGSACPIPLSALSPISARAASPNEADFEAIREAFVETARGRWFLEEYTKRNRNADTALVLDAVARIERTLAAQKELKAEEPSAPPAPDLTETMAAIKAIITAARSGAEAALSGASMDEALAPTRKCARVIREIAWGLRESGADGRICSLLDSQVEAINAACDQIPTSGFRDDVLGAFDQAVQQIDQLGASGDPIAEIRQPGTATLADEPRSTSAATADETPNVSSDVSARVSNDNNAAAFEIAAASPLPEDASSMGAASASAADTHSAPAPDVVETMDAVTPAASQPDIVAQADVPEDTVAPHVASEASADVAESNAFLPEHAPSELIVSEEQVAGDATAAGLASEAADSIALDESLFDLSADSAVQTSSDTEASVQQQDTMSSGVREPSAAVEASTDEAIETAAAEDESQQTTPAPEPEIVAAEQEPVELVASSATADQVTVVPQVVESLEAMADIAIEETASDEVAFDQTRSFETIEIVDDQRPSDDAPQIAEMAEEPAEPMATVAVAASAADAEPDVTSEISPVAPSDDAPHLVPEETSSVSVKTPLPDNMLGEAIARTFHSSASMEMPVAVETASALVPNHVMSFAAGATTDAITPPVSLGASLIASGIVAKPETPRNDPLAAFRRMSHAERIAFFS